MSARLSLSKLIYHIMDPFLEMLRVATATLQGVLAIHVHVLANFHIIMLITTSSTRLEAIADDFVGVQMHVAMKSAV